MTDVFNADATIETVEDKPVKTSDDRLKDKDNFIEQLKTEMADLRKELGQRVDAETQLTDLRNELKALKEQRTNQSRENTTPALSEVEIKTLVQKAMTETEATRTHDQNIKDANEQLVLKFGGDVKKAGEAVVSKAKELNLSVPFLKDVAAKSPSAFLEVMGVRETRVETDNTFVQSSVNSEGIRAENKVVAKEGTKAYFDNIRRENPKLYWTPETQQRIWKAAKSGTYQ